MGEEFAQKMNCPPRINKHILFSTTSSSSSSADDIIPHVSTPLVGDTTKPMIKDELSLKSSPSPQAKKVIASLHQVIRVNLALNLKLLCFLNSP